MPVQLVNDLENFECDSDSENKEDYGDLNEMSTDINSCHEDSDKDF